MRYRVFYDNEKMYDSTAGGKPPARGVQVILQDNTYVGVESVTSSDYYVLRDGRWCGVDIFGLFDYLMETGLVLFGRTISAEEYDAVMQRVQTEKHGWTARERQ